MRQGELFTREPVTNEVPLHIPGFSLVDNYVTAEEEHRLLELVDSGTWQSDLKRRIQQYGFGYAGGSNPTWVLDFPAWLSALAERVQHDAPFARLPDNCVINEYVPPQGIGPHKDYADFGPTVACVSLGSDIVTDFVHEELGSKRSVLVPARSFWVITGPARWQWTHGIAGRLNDVVHGAKRRRARRVSITFRTLRIPHS